MIEIKTFESGSAGNLYLIRNESKRFLVEAGLPIRKIRKYLDFNMDLDACFLSHSHLDHAKSAKEIMKAGIDLYCSDGTAEALGLSGHRLKLPPWKTSFEKNGFNLFSFFTNHDTPGAMGFIIDLEDDRILFATDTGSLPFRIPQLTHIMIEANYSEREMTDSDPYLLDRVRKTHMSIQNVVDFLDQNDLSMVREIHLIHLSKRNANPEYFKKVIKRRYGLPVIIG
jgi:phosphoribosyl 1,2-cyclic phosphodiesterase